MNPLIMFRPIAQPSHKVLPRVTSAPVLYQGLYLEVFFTFNLDWLGWVCGWASRGVLAKLGDVETTVNIFENPPEIQSVGSLPNSLWHPERSNKPRTKLPSPRQMKCLRREQHFFYHLMLLKSVVLVEVALLVLLGSLEMILGILDKLLNVLYEVNSSRSPTWMPNNCINR